MLGSAAVLVVRPIDCWRRKSLACRFGSWHSEIVVRRRGDPRRALLLRFLRRSDPDDSREQVELSRLAAGFAKSN